MLEIIKERMNNSDYAAFIIDYKRLIEVRENKSLWRAAIYQKNKRIKQQPLLKEFFDYLSNAYDYKLFKGLILTDDSIADIISGGFILPHTKEIKEAIQLHYTIEVYCSFIIEEVIATALSSKSIVERNNYLDFVEKADIKCGGFSYQIKNKSFIYEVEEIERLTDRYIRVNDKLRFIFYSLESDNIYICMIDEKPFLLVTEINNFTNRSSYKLTTIENLTNSIEKER